jgi:hypothetical protein
MISNLQGKFTGLLNGRVGPAQNVSERKSLQKKRFLSLPSKKKCAMSTNQPMECIAVKVH